MRITIENDENILKEGTPEIQTVIINRMVGPELSDVLELIEDALMALGYRFKGSLVIEDDFESIDKDK